MIPRAAQNAELGVAQRVELQVDVANMKVAGQDWIPMNQRGPLVLDGTYDFLSGLHHETYIYRARGDKRLVYVAQAQNDWDDRIVATPDIKSARDLEGKKMIFTSSAPCVLGNLKHSLQLGGADLERIEFVGLDEPKEKVCHAAVTIATSLSPSTNNVGNGAASERLSNAANSSRSRSSEASTPALLHRGTEHSP